MELLWKSLDYLEEWLIVLLLSVMVFLNFTNVVLRAFSPISFSFTEELTIMLFVWVSMFGVSVAYKRYVHLGMDYVVSKFPKHLQAYFTLLSMGCSVIMIVILIWLGYGMVLGQIALRAKTTALGMPLYWQGLSIPVGGCFILLRVLQSGIERFYILIKTDI